MAMVGNTLGSEIVTALIATDYAQDDGTGNTEMTAIWQAVGSAIVAHITTNAVIATTVAVASVTLVTVGTGVSGPGAGTGTGTIS